MKWAASLSEQTSLEKAVKECASAIKKSLAGAEPDMLCAFISQSFAERYKEAAELIRAELPAKTFIGCSAGGVIGAGREVENRPALSLTAAVLPGVDIKPFVVQDEDLPDMDASPRAWETIVGVKAMESPQFILLTDPYSFRADSFIVGLDYAFPKAVKVGGLASGAQAPGDNALFLDNLCLRSGLVGLALLGDVAVDTIVAQGCRPIGPPLTITDCEQNILLGVNGKPPLHMLQAIVDELPDSDRELVPHSLFIGLAMDPHKEKQERGDFLIRNIVGADGQKGILAIGALLRRGQTMQFHLRDAKTSEDDLRHLLGRYEPMKDKARGALLFSCMGRGEYLYGRPDHDSRLFQSAVGAVPLGGFFCNGEIGPVSGTTYLHGYTSCFGLFRPKS